MRVVVVGGGWAGLAAAVELCRQDIHVTLIEAAPQLGGRARAVTRGGVVFDNGQHLFIGAYREVLRLMTIVGVAEERVFLRRPLHWLMRHPNAPSVEISAPHLPAPLHMAWALLRARGYHFAERRAALRACARVLRPPATAGDVTVAAWLRQSGQPPRVIDTLWSPLCLAALNTPIEQASAEVFVRVLRDAFLERRADSDLLIPRCDLGGVFPAPAAAFIQGRGGHIQLGERVNVLLSDGARITGVRTRRADYPAEQVILAVPPESCAALLAGHPTLAPLLAPLAALGTQPICTAYLRYAPGLPLAIPMTGMAGGLGQWLFDLTVMDKPGWVAVVISGPGRHMAMDNESLLNALAAEIAALWPGPARYQEGFVIREKRATFSCEAGINALRLPPHTALAGCRLAGDHTATGYPSTLEGAVRSGVSCAQDIIALRNGMDAPYPSSF